jgi:GGDEF domain-containing protein
VRRAPTASQEGRRACGPGGRRRRCRRWRQAGGERLTSPLRVTVSIGVATLDGSRRGLEDMLAAADAALYEAKNTGRNRVCMLVDGSRGR